MKKEIKFNHQVQTPWFGPRCLQSPSTWPETIPDSRWPLLDSQRQGPCPNELENIRGGNKIRSLKNNK